MEELYPFCAKNEESASGDATPNFSGETDADQQLRPHQDHGRKANAIADLFLAAGFDILNQPGTTALTSAGTQVVGAGSVYKSDLANVIDPDLEL